MNLRMGLMATVAAFSMVGVASAAPITGQISIGGYAQSANSMGMGQATGLNFASGPSTAPVIVGDSGLLYSYGAGTGTFTGLGCSSDVGGCGTIQNIADFSTQGPTTSFLTLSGGTGASVSFDLQSITDVGHGSDLYGGSVTFTAMGKIKEVGYDDTDGTFILTAQGNNIVSFSATTLSSSVPMPEPASMAILGAGLAAVGLVRRKRADRAA